MTERPSVFPAKTRRGCTEDPRPVCTKRRFPTPFAEVSVVRLKRSLAPEPVDQLKFDELVPILRFKLVIGSRRSEYRVFPPSGIHEPFIAKHPLFTLIPFANVEVALPVTANDPVVVAFVVVALVAVNCWNEETAVVEVATKLSATTLPATDSRAYGEVVPIPTFTANAPVPPRTREFDAPTLALDPIAVALVRVPESASDWSPKKRLRVPVVLVNPANAPRAVDDAPAPVWLRSACQPRATDAEPVVFKRPASFPEKMLLEPVVFEKPAPFPEKMF